MVRSALARSPQLRTPDSGGGNCGGEGGGVGDGSAAAALIAFIRRCLPSRRCRGMWTPLIGRERPARRGRHGPAPPPAPSLLRDSRPRRTQAPPPPRPAPRNPDPGRRAPRPRRAPGGRRPAAGLRSPPAGARPPPTQRTRTRDDGGSRWAPYTHFPEGAACPSGSASCRVAAGEPGTSVRFRSALGLVSLARPLALHLQGCAVHPDVSLGAVSCRRSRGRNAAAPFPRGPNLICRLGNPASQVPSRGLHRPRSPSPAGSVP